MDRESAECTVDPRVDLAVLRTELAWDRTLLAWLRTALGLMGAGVAFDKGAQIMHQERMMAGTALVRSGHVVGLTLTAVSTLLLVIVGRQYWQGVHGLARIKGGGAPGFSPALVASVVVVLLGAGVFVVLLLDQH